MVRKRMVWFSESCMKIWSFRQQTYVLSRVHKFDNRVNDFAKGIKNSALSFWLWVVLVSTSHDALLIKWRRLANSDKYDSRLTLLVTLRKRGDFQRTSTTKWLNSNDLLESLEAVLMVTLRVVFVLLYDISEP